MSRRILGQIITFLHIGLISAYPRTTARFIHHNHLDAYSHESYFPNQRFWTKSITFVPDETTISSSSTPSTTAELVERIRDRVHESKDILPSAETGVVIYPYKKLLIPVHEGIVQPQHAILMEDNFPMNEDDYETKNKLVVCGFSRRANHVTVSPTEEERPTDLIRLVALDIALFNTRDGITGEELLSDKFAGTSPSRIYRSFICPRPKAKQMLEPVERAAGRTAAQILLALRQVRADKAEYLRNNDKSIHLEEAASSKPKNPIIVVLDNVRSAFNVGSLFRTSETAGVAELITVGITPHPPHPKLRKTAFSSLDVVPSRHFDDMDGAIAALKADGYTIVVMETTSLSKQYTKVKFPKKVAIVLGNEVTGVDPRIIELADIVTEIPTFGVKNSLNVASAAPIVMFEILRQWEEADADIVDAGI